MRLGSKLAAAVGAWLVWYNVVLVKAAKSLEPWGPNWLARAASGCLMAFGSFWLNFSHNGEELAAKGIFGEGQQYVMAWHPHGAFTIAALYFISSFWARHYPGNTPRFVCVAPLLLKIPILSEYLLLCHARDQDRKTFDGLLATGATVAVQPGGLIEQVETDDAQERVFFPGNLGFVRLALRHGKPLLPVYAFGENQLFQTTSWVKNLNSWFYRKFKTGNMVVLGLGGVPSTPLMPSPLLLPRFKSGLHVRWGNPVEVGSPVEDPSDELVQLVFERYVQELRRLFNEYKDECLPPAVAAKGLEVIVRTKKGSLLLPEVLSDVPVMSKM